MSQLTTDEQLGATLYQFLQLYERWSEDRQTFVKQNANLSELSKIFLKQVQNFADLEEKVQNHIASTIKSAASNAVKQIKDEISGDAHRATKQIANQLLVSVNETEKTLDRLNGEAITTTIKFIGISFISSLATALFIFWFFTPAPILPLTHTQILELHDGQIAKRVWSKISKKEQDRLLKLAGVEKT